MVYSAAGLVSGASAFIVLPFFSRFLTVQEYGVYEYLSVVLVLTGAFVTLEIKQGLARYIPSVRDDRIHLRTYASTALWFTACTYLLLACVMGCFGNAISLLVFNDEEQSTVFLIAAISFGFSGINNVIVSLLQWDFRARSSAILSVVISLASVAFSLAFVWGLKAGLIGVYLGATLGGIVSVLLGLWVAKGYFILKFSTKALREMVSFSAPLIFSTVGWVLASYIDRLVIKELLSFESVGVYGLGFRLSGIVVLVISGFELAVSPMIYAHHQEPETPDRIAQMLRVFSVVAILMCGGLTAFSPELLMIFATSAYNEAVLVIPFLTSSILLARFYIFAPGMVLAKKTMLYASLNISMGALNLGLNYLMIPIWGIMGAAAATLVSACVSFAAFMFFSQRYYPVPHRFGPLMLMALAGFGIMLLTVCGQYVHDIGFLARLGAFLCLLMLPFILGVVSPAEVKGAAVALWHQFSRKG